MVDTIIYQKDRNNIRRKVTKLLSFVMCLMFKNIKLIFQIYDNTNNYYKLMSGMRLKRRHWRTS